MTFNPEQYDLNTPEGKAAYIAAWKVDLKAKGYRVDEEHEREAPTGNYGRGALTLNGLAGLCDQYVHNIHLTLKEAVEQLGGWDSEGGKVVMHFAPTFWSPGYGSWIDKFGVPWMVSTSGDPTA